MIGLQEQATFVLSVILDLGLVVRVPDYRYRGPSSIPELPDFLRIVGLERGPRSLVRTTEELFGRKSSGSGLDSREYCRRDPSC
jgi:hypothetical protein